MGQAKKRGTFEQRIEQARERFDVEAAQRFNENEQLDALETRQKDALGNWLDTQVLPQMERKYGALMRADFTLVPLKNRDLTPEEAAKEFLKEIA